MSITNQLLAKVSKRGNMFWVAAAMCIALIAGAAGTAYALHAKSKPQMTPVQSAGFETMTRICPQVKSLNEESIAGTISERDLYIQTAPIFKDMYDNMPAQAFGSFDPKGFLNDITPSMVPMVLAPIANVCVTYGY